MLMIVALILMIAGAVLLPSDKYTSYDTGIGTVVVAILLILAGLVAMFTYFGREDSKCSDKGGTYLVREGKCVDIKEIP